MGKERAHESNGLPPEGENISPELNSFFVRVKAAFDSNHSFLGFSDAAVAVLEQMTESDISAIGIVFDRKHPEAFERDWEASLLAAFRESVGQKKWNRFELESTKRHLRDDHYYGSTPG